MESISTSNKATQERIEAGRKAFAIRCAALKKHYKDLGDNKFDGLSEGAFDELARRDKELAAYWFGALDIRPDGEGWQTFVLQEVNPQWQAGWTGDQMSVGDKTIHKYGPFKMNEFEEIWKLYDEYKERERREAENLKVTSKPLEFPNWYKSKYLVTPAAVQTMFKE